MCTLQGLDLRVADQICVITFGFIELRFENLPQFNVVWRPYSHLYDEDDEDAMLGRLLANKRIVLIHFGIIEYEMLDRVLQELCKK